MNSGQVEDVAKYCESDVLNTYRVWLVYELFRGSLTLDRLTGARRRHASLFCPVSPGIPIRSPRSGLLRPPAPNVPHS